MFVISHGQAVISKHEGHPSDEHELMRLGEHTYFGERALLTHDTRAATVRAVGALNTMFLSRAAFEQILGPLQARRRDPPAQPSPPARSLTVSLSPHPSP